jgi:hypothetical protein
MTAVPCVKIKTRLEITDSQPPWYILRVPKTKVASFGFKGNLRRVVCTLNGSETFNCSLFPSKGDYFLTVNKKLRDKFDLAIGDQVTVELRKDESQFGMPMPDEFAEVLRQDPDGEKLFNALSPGNQRLMLKLIDAVKDVDKRIARALVGVEELKRSNGKFDWRSQELAMKAATSPGIGFEMDEQFR